MPSPSYCRFGRDCWYGRQACRYQHSFLDDLPVTVRDGSDANVVNSESELIRENVSAEFEVDCTPDNAAPLSLTPLALSECIITTLAKRFSNPEVASDVRNLEFSLCPVDIQRQILSSFSILPLLELQKTKRFRHSITPKLLKSSTETAAFRWETVFLLRNADSRFKETVGDLAGSDEDWVRFRASALKSVNNAVRFWALYKKRLPRMMSSADCSTQKDFLHSKRVFLEELRVESGIKAVWPHYRTNTMEEYDANGNDNTISSNHTVLYCVPHERVMKVWMARLKATTQIS
eukprot:CFRG5439T1